MRGRIRVVLQGAMPSGAAETVVAWIFANKKIDHHDDDE
jgi:hypothetical protein